jgi:riboflavin kinase/FMN adenylyltransferase
METYNQINDNNKNLSIALGFFDGIHIGHRAVLSSAVSYAKNNGLKSAVITFENHPKCYLNNLKPKYIISKKEKLDILENLGLDFVYFLKFDENFVKLSAKSYLELLYNNLSPKAISTGTNHTFGKDKEGNSEYLYNMQKVFNYKYFNVDSQKLNDIIISSSLIRKSLENGNIEYVNKMLDRQYSFEETVVKGEQIGRTLGFRTANLYYPEDILNIGRGVYSVDVLYNGCMYKGVANFGMRPSLENTKIPLLEVHILNFDENIYGKTIKVFFNKKIRNEKKFNSLDELKVQIAKDINAVI